ncbi:MAG: hypothetical protein F4058_04320 [Rhodothermaceae bacterium]|nr:hypothetical protein [Rhodothermaceae bacterium]MYF62889.1 hypothetical protein [Rhodothermaceae bacterium]MYI84544.1 hypothetical protein [Rhodothermaceae bacterium]
MRFEAFIVDGLGCGMHSPEEADVLSRILAERYKNGSISVVSYLAF